MLGYKRNHDGVLEIIPDEAEIVKLIFNSYLSEMGKLAIANMLNEMQFTGKIQCQCCGKNYRRKTTATGVVWICATYNTKGKKYCPTAKQIPENTLISVCCEVLDTSEFDVEIFENQIAKILVPAPNELTFIFTDEQEISANRKDRSRSESWTPEMKKATGERSRFGHLTARENC